VGDEPLLLAQVAPTIVARDRAAGARAAEALGADVLVMDDGFQNPSLAKDLVLLVVDGQRGLGNGRVLPAGPLRAPLAPQLDRAHALVVMGDIAAAAEEVVEMAVKRGLPVLAARLQPEAPAVAALSRKPLLAYSGIGDPQRFLATLATAGLDVRASRAFGDHHRYTPIDAQRLLTDADLLRLDLVTTEKDLARLEGGKRLDRDDRGSNRSDVMNVIDPDGLERDDREKPVPAFSHPALAELARRSRALPVRAVFADEAALRRLVLNALAAGHGA
jgi:tetraacyldisaccharide 4'-kinase